MKQCNKCKRTLDEAKFYKDKTKRDGYTTICGECICQWKRDNREHVKEYNHKYAQEHKARGAERQYNRRHKSEEAMERARENHRKWVAEHPERHKEHKDRDYKKNTEAYIQRACLRRVRVKGLRADFTCEQWKQVKKLFHYRCAYCGEKPKKLTQEHIIPVSEYGEYTLGNIIPACPGCNASKHHKDLVEWYPQQVFFDVERLKAISAYVSEHANQSGRLDVTA